MITKTYKKVGGIVKKNVGLKKTCRTLNEEIWYILGGCDGLEDRLLK